MAVLIDLRRNMIIYERPDLSPVLLAEKNERYATLNFDWRWSDDEDTIENLPRVFYYLADARGRDLKRDFISKQESEARQEAETRGKWHLKNSCPSTANHHLYMICETCGQKD